MKHILLAAFSAVLLTGCIIDDSGSGYYDRDPYYDDYDHYERDRYGYRRDRDRWDDGYDRGYRDGRRDDGPGRRHHEDRRPAGPARPGDFTAGGGAKEFPFPAGHHRCTIEVVDGSVGFRTIVVRRGGAKQSITVNATLQRGQRYDVPIDAQATGLRISDTGRGRYRVIVR